MHQNQFTAIINKDKSKWTLDANCSVATSDNNRTNSLGKLFILPKPCLCASILAALVFGERA